MISIEKKANFNYIDITDTWIKSANPNSHEIKEKHYYEYQGKKYYVDNRNIVLDYSKKEREVAEWLKETFGGEIYMNPRVNKPDGIQTADYIFRNEYWDLKEITGVGKNILFHAVEDHKKQAHNFIFDITKTKLKNEEIIERLEKLYQLKSLYWLDKIIIKRNTMLIKVAKKKQPLRLTVGPLLLNIIYLFLKICQSISKIR